MTLSIACSFCFVNIGNHNMLKRTKKTFGLEHAPQMETAVLLYCCHEEQMMLANISMLETTRFLINYQLVVGATLYYWFKMEANHLRHLMQIQQENLFPFHAYLVVARRKSGCTTFG
jgi:hypothetical protein